LRDLLVLYTDELGTASGEQLELLDAVLGLATGQGFLPFGGVQVVWAGDGVPSSRLFPPAR
jgi:uncharacterized protein related to proFAR isomerase